MSDTRYEDARPAALAAAGRASAGDFRVAAGADELSRHEAWGFSGIHPGTDMLFNEGWPDTGDSCP